MDTKGTKVSSIGIEKYYQSRKQQAIMAEEGKREQHEQQLHQSLYVKVKSDYHTIELEISC